MSIVISFIWVLLSFGGVVGNGRSKQKNRDFNSIHSKINQVEEAGNIYLIVGILPKKHKSSLLTDILPATEM